MFALARRNGSEARTVMFEQALVVLMDSYGVSGRVTEGFEVISLCDTGGSET